MNTEPTPEVQSPVHRQWGGAHHYAELARISAWLFVGLIALMTFLLSAGLQHPQKLFSTTMYVSLISLPLVLIAYTIGFTLQQQLISKKIEQANASTQDNADNQDKPDTKAKPNSVSKLKKSLRVVRLTQQALFIISILAVTSLALVSAHMFFSPAPSSSQPVPAQGQ